VNVGHGSDRIVVVTGASRGAGKGIAIALGATGATVYVTGRTITPGTGPLPSGGESTEGSQPLPGTIAETAEAISAAGGIGIPVQCDHGDDRQVKVLFERIAKEHGRLDILVNNASAIPEGVTDHGPFWERPMGIIDMLDVGARSSFVASWHAAPLLIASGGGLLVNTSGYGGGCYLHGPAYGCAKAAVDKMARDMGHDLRPYDVCSVSLWMGLLKTERTQELFRDHPGTWGARAQTAESPRFIGRVIDALHRAPDRMARSGKVWIAAELGLELGVLEDDGLPPRSRRADLGGPWAYNPAVID
jgi:NAD(P)-dependent dehydrogenase (short-subunit alcohol dehydrogenase family)